MGERTCTVLGLFQCMALHPETTLLFLDGNKLINQASLHLYLYPFIHNPIKTKPFEHLRVTSLGVIGALVKAEDSNAISQLMNTEIILLCLRTMKRGTDLSRTVSTFIIQKILLDDKGLKYVCDTGERLVAVSYC